MRSSGLLCLVLLVFVSCRPSSEHFLLAAKQGDVDQVRRLLDRGADIGVTDRKGQTALHLAAQWGREEAAEILLARGASFEAVTGKARTSRTDYIGSEGDNFLVDAIADSRMALGYVPFAYLEPNRRRLKAVAIDTSKGPVLPTKGTVESEQYQPLSRPLFIYVNQRSAVDSVVRQFVEYYLPHAPDLVEQVRYVPFKRDFYPVILGKFQQGRAGTIFEGKSPIGMTIEQFLALQDRR